MSAPLPYRVPDDADAPPPYEASQATTATAVPPSLSQPRGPQVYPVLDTSHQDNDGTSSSAPPPSIDYYPAMSTAVAPTTPTATHSVYYPPMSPSSGAQQQYHANLPTAPPLAVSPDAPYGPYYGDVKVGPTDLPDDQVRPTELPRPPPRNPVDMSSWSGHRDDGTGLIAEPPVTMSGAHVMPSSPPSLSVSPQSALTNSFAAMQVHAQPPPQHVQPPPQHFQPPPLHVQPPPTLHAQSPPFMSMAVPLVTTYKCGRCGAILESETAVCKRLHSLSLAETFVKNATKLDLDERRRCDARRQSSASTVSSSAGSAPAAYGGSRDNAPAPYGGSGDNPPAPYGGSGDNPPAPYGGSGSTSNAPAPHAPYGGSSRKPKPPKHFDGTNGHYPGYQAYYGRGSEDSSTYGNMPCAESNYGTNEAHVRRTASVQNPMTTLKKFWRDTKNEIKHQKSQRAHVQQEVVTPSALPPAAVDHGYNNSTTSHGSSSSSSGSHSEPSMLNRSNTCTPAPTPAYNPAYVSP
ncbi:hypothetical protein BGX31_009985 [Mortierella sp. GBA43]|nr:hypothetical protein BGX31_009985 [Mortierella sp. GBA43]